MFRRGKRPSGRDVHSLAKGGGGFSVTFDPGDGAAVAQGGVGDAPVWLELLSSGLSFDLTGLAPGPPAEAPPFRRSLGLDEADLQGVDAITLYPGPHLAGGAGLLPIMRTLAGIGATLAQLGGVRAVCWHSSRCWSEPGLYAQGVDRWLDGGVFPALTLTSLALASDGGMHSEGLALFIGQELRLEPDLTEEPVEAAKLAVRLIDHLVERGRVAGRETVAGADGAPLRLEPSANGRFVRVWRD